MQAAILSDRQILQAKDEGRIVIEPFNPQQLNNCSYDITLGASFFKPASQKPEIVDPEDPESVGKYWQGPYLTEDYIVIPPGGHVLAHTQEFIGGQGNLTTMLKAKSTMARCRLTICGDAGWGDIGYINRWGMVLQNQSHATLRLRVGSRIGQIIFLQSDVPSAHYSDKGQYQNQNLDLTQLMNKWNVMDIIPAKSRAYLVKPEI